MGREQTPLPICEEQAIAELDALARRVAAVTRTLIDGGPPSDPEDVPPAEVSLERIGETAGRELSELSEISRIASALTSLRLEPQQDIELSVQLLDRLREVGQRLSDVTLMWRARSAHSAVGGSEGSETGIETGLDLHENSPSLDGSGSPSVGDRRPSETRVRKPASDGPAPCTCGARGEKAGAA